MNEEDIMYYHIQQNDDWSCLACVAAMVVGKKSIKDFVKFVGHDGSKKIPTSLHPDKYTGFYMIEAVRYLSKYNLHIGCYLNADFKVPLKIFGKDRPAIITVQSKKYAKCLHIICWTGDVVLDPRHTKPTKLSEYEIKEWWPLVHWGM